MNPNPRGYNTVRGMILWVISNDLINPLVDEVVVGRSVVPAKSVDCGIGV